MADANLIAQGNNITELPAYEDALRPGEKAYLTVQVDGIPSADDLSLITEQLAASGVLLTAPVTYDSQLGLIIQFQKSSQPAPEQIGAWTFPLGMSPTTAITAGLGILAAIGLFVFGWQLVKNTSNSGVLAIWILIGIVAFVMVIRSREGHAVAVGVGRMAEKGGTAAIARWSGRPYEPRRERRVERSSEALPATYIPGTATGAGRGGGFNIPISEEK